MHSSRNHFAALSFAVAALVLAAAALRVSIEDRGYYAGGPLPQSSSAKIRAETSNVAPSFFEDDAEDSVGASNGPGNFTSIEKSVLKSISNGLPSEKSPPAVPRPTAKAYLIGNVGDGTVYFGLNIKVPLPVASMSKLVTAMAALYKMPATSTVEITAEEAAYPPDQSNLKPGERFTMDELLYPMLLSSSNVAAEALASSADRAKFLELMSSYAWEIGMPATFFADPSGLDPRNTASAEDIFALAKYLYDFHPDILAITRSPSFEIATTSDHGSHSFASIHPFVKDPRFIGGKTGRTPQAGETMLTILRIDGQPIAFIVLGSALGSREYDTRILIDRFEKRSY